MCSLLGNFHAYNQLSSYKKSLYLFLLNQNNRANWVEWFKCPFDLAMSGSCISSKKTYYKCLNELMEWGLIEYRKGSNNWKAPLIKLEVLKDTSTVPQSEPQVLQLVEPLVEQLGTHIYKLITNNLERIKKDLPIWLKEKPNKDEINIKTFLHWFNEQKLLNTGKQGKFKMLTSTDENNLKKLLKSYNGDDFKLASENLFDSEWARENSMFTPSHFLRVENFNKYLNKDVKKTPIVVDPNEYLQR